jgi:hypothetical protein
MRWYEDDISTARTALGAVDFEDVYHQGRQMTLDALLSFLTQGTGSDLVRA